MNNSINLKKGFTLPELVVVITILAILSLISISVFKNFRDQEALTKDNGLIVEVLRQAKSLTLNSKSSNQYGVHFGTNSVVLFICPTYSSSASTNLVYNLNPDVRISNISLSGGGSDLLFQKLSGETVNNGTITLTSVSAGTTKVITIYKTGLVE